MIAVALALVAVGAASLYGTRLGERLYDRMHPHSAPSATPTNRLS